MATPPWGGGAMAGARARYAGGSGRGLGDRGLTRRKEGARRAARARCEGVGGFRSCYSLACRGTSLIRNCSPLGTYSRTMPGA